MNRLRLHGTRVDVTHFLAGHGGDRKFDAAFHGVERDVAMGVVYHDSTFSADHFDPSGRKIGISRREHPSRTDGEYAAVVQRDHDPGAIRNVVSRLHDFADFLGIYANGLAWRE